MTQVVVCGGGGWGGVGGGVTGSSQCWPVGQLVHSSLLPTMASVASDEDVFAQSKQQSRCGGGDGSFGFCDGGGCGNVRSSLNTYFGPFYSPEFSGHSTKD